MLFADYAAAGSLARDEAALDVAREPVSPVGRLLEFDRPLTGRVFHSPVAVDVAEQKVAALLPPHRAFSRAVVAAHAVGKLVDWLAGAYDPVKFRLQLFDPFHVLCGCGTAEAGAEGGATGCRRCEHVSPRQADSHDDPPLFVARHYSSERV